MKIIVSESFQIISKHLFERLLQNVFLEMKLPKRAYFGALSVLSQSSKQVISRQSS
jgi:hypothetical protein